jgi:hypothetical protein
MGLAQDKELGRYRSHNTKSCLNHEKFAKLSPLTAKWLNDRLQSQERDASDRRSLAMSCHSLSVNRSSDILFCQFRSSMQCWVCAEAHLLLICFSSESARSVISDELR